MISTRLLYALTAGTLLLALLLLIRGPSPHHPEILTPWMLRFDDNGDGVLSPTELAPSARYPEDFELFDSDKNGSIDPVELEVLLTRIDPEWIEGPPS